MKMEAFDVTVLGGKAAGKTSLCNQLVYQRFSRVYQPTVRENYNILLDLPNRRSSIRCAIMDTMGQDDQDEVPDDQVLAKDGFLIVYDMHDKNSLNGARSICSSLVDKLDEDTDGYPIYLIGTKQDCCTSDEEKSSVIEDAEALVNDYDLRDHLICSAMDAGSVKRVFSSLMEAMLMVKNPENKVKQININNNNHRQPTMSSRNRIRHR